MQYECEFGVGDKVFMEDDPSILGRVLAVEFRGGSAMAVEVGWMHSGDARKTWFEVWRLRRSPE